ncbi:putative transcription factor GRF family [Helianthus annuus]|nr:putative transcription factor GRF family [Helianthus annuus]
MSQKSAASSNKKSSQGGKASQFICSCGAATWYKVSKTEANPNRRFLCCQDCGFIRWADTPLSPPSSSCPGCEKNNELVEEVADNELDLVSPVLKEEWFDDYDAVIEVLKAKYEASLPDPAADYDSEELEWARWECAVQPQEDDWYHDPYPGEHSFDSEWSNDDAHWK